MGKSRSAHDVSLREQHATQVAAAGLARDEEPAGEPEGGDGGRRNRGPVTHALRYLDRSYVA
jgi:hypothetical protein